MKTHQNIITKSLAFVILEIIFLKCQGQIVYDLINDIGNCNLPGWNILFLSQNSACRSTTCSGYDFLNFNNTIISTHQFLPKHYQIKISLQLLGYQVEDEPREVYIYLDNIKINFQISTNIYTTYPISKKKLVNYEGNLIFHTSNSLSIFIHSGLYLWNVKYLKLYIYTCENNCNYCEYSSSCQNYQIYRDLNQQGLLNFQGWLRSQVVQVNEYQKIQTVYYVMRLIENIVYEKRIPINLNCFYRISFKIMSEKQPYFRMRAL